MCVSFIFHTHQCQLKEIYDSLHTDFLLAACPSLITQMGKTIKKTVPERGEIGLKTEILHRAVYHEETNFPVNFNGFFADFLRTYFRVLLNL